MRAALAASSGRGSARLQTAAHGVLGGMFKAYGSNMDGMERAAYEFGGWTEKYSYDTQRYNDKLDPVFQMIPIRRRRRR